MYTVFDDTSVYTTTNVYAFLNLLEIPVDPKDRTGRQQAIFREALSWGRTKCGSDLTVACHPHRFRQSCILVTLTRFHDSYDRSSAMVRTASYSQTYYHGYRVHRCTESPWTISDGSGAARSHPVTLPAWDLLKIPKATEE